MSIKILEGNFGRTYEVLNVLEKLYKKNKNIFNKIFSKCLLNNTDNKEINISSTSNVLCSKIESLIEIYNENKSNPYPIMRNYSIFNNYKINKNLLFSPTKGGFSNSSSIATDSRYLYIILSGVNGGMIKVGTGEHRTIQGKVYLYEKIPNLAPDDSTYQWVYLKGKLYLKSVTSNYSSISGTLINNSGHLTIISPENFSVLGKTKLLLPEATKHPILKRKNDNYLLLSDGENLNVVILEPVMKFSEGEDNKTDTQNEELSDEEDLINPLNNPNSAQQMGKDYYKKNKLVNFKNQEQIVTYPADVFSYINLMLYTFPIDSENSNRHLKNNSNLTGSRITSNLKNSISYNSEECINEIYEAFSYLFTKEQCRKALILNNWNISKTAFYLVENEKEIKQPILVPEENILLFQTRIESTIYKSTRSEFKITKNSIFDVTQYDLLKWVITKEQLIAYKLKEGACVLFSRNPSDVKEFKYSYTEKISPLNVNNLTSFPGYTPDYKYVIPSGNPFLAEESLGFGFSHGANNISAFNYEKKLLEEIYKDSLRNEGLAQQGKGQQSLHGQHKNSQLSAFKEYVSISASKQGGSSAQPNLSNQGISMPISFLRDIMGNSQNQVGNNISNNASKIDKAILKRTNPFIIKEQILERLEGTNYNNSKLSNFEEEVVFSEKKKKKETKDLKEAKGADKDTFTKPSTHSMTKKDRKEEMAKKLKKLQDKVAEMRENVNKDNNQNLTNKDEMINLEEKIIQDVVKGSYIKVIPCLQLSKYDCVFCYDQLLKIYYLVTNSSPTFLNIFVSSTFEENSKKMKEVIFDNSCFKDEKQLLEYFTRLLNIQNISEIISNFDFEQFSNTFTTLLLLLQTKKSDLFYKYKNWNYYYTSLLDNLTSRPILRDPNFEPMSYSADYSLPLLPQSEILLNKNTLKTIFSKIEKSGEWNQKLLLDNLPEEVKSNFKVSESTVASAHNYFKSLWRYFYISSIKGGDSWANFNFMGELEFEPNDENLEIPDLNYLKDKLTKNTIFIINNRLFLQSIDSDENTLNLIINNLQEKLNNKLSSENTSKIYQNLLILFYWVENFNSNFPSEIIKKDIRLNENLNKVRQILENILKLSNVQLSKMVYRIYLSNWELLFDNLDSGVKLFYKLYHLYINEEEEINKNISPTLSSRDYEKIKISYDKLSSNLAMNIIKLNPTELHNDNLNISYKNIFFILIQKLTLSVPASLYNNHNRINSIKSYTLSLKDISENFSDKKLKIIAHSTLNPLYKNNLSIPFHWIILGYFFNIKNYKLNLDLSEKASKDKQLKSINTNFNQRSKDKLDKGNQSILFGEISKKQIKIKFDSDKLIENSPFIEYIDNYETFQNFEKHPIKKYNVEYDLHSFNNLLFPAEENNYVKMIEKLMITTSEENFNKISEMFWENLSNEILNNENSILLKILNDFFLMSIGDINEFYHSINKKNHFNTLSSLDTSKKFTLCYEDDSLLIKTYQFIVVNLNFIKKTITSILNKNIHTLESTSLKLPENLISYINNVITSSISLTNKLPIKIIQNLHSILSDILTGLNNILKKVTTDIQILSSTGHILEKEKILEYSLGSEIIQIYENLKFPGCDSIVVEIELKSAKEKSYCANYDLLVVSNEHPYSNMRYNTNNNYNNFGTCFTMKIGNNLNKKLFLTGEEIKIISPSELEFNRNFGRSTGSSLSGISSKYYGGSKVNLGMGVNSNINNKQGVKDSNLSKAILKIRAYPFSEVLIKEQNKDNSLNKHIIHLVKDLDYYLINLNKKFIKSIPCEEMLDDSHNQIVIKQGFYNYEEVKKVYEKIYSNLVINNCSNDNNVYVSSADAGISSNLDNLLISGNINYYFENLVLLNNNHDNIFLNYFNELKVYDFRIRGDLQYLLNKLKEISENDYSSFSSTEEKKFEEELSNTKSGQILINVRNLIKESNEYLSLKMIPTFRNNFKFKLLWKLLEHVFIICIIYYLNVNDKFDDRGENNYLEMIGKKINYLLTWMSNRVKAMKDTFDNLKNYVLDIVETNNNMVNEIKVEMIDKIIKIRQMEQIEKLEKQKKQVFTETHKFKQKDDIKKEEKSKLATKTLNFKKKSNVKRMYQEIPKKKKKDTPKTNELVKSTIDSNNDEKISCTLESKKETELPIEELKNKPLSFFFDNYISVFLESPSMIDKMNLVKSQMKEKVEADIKEAYFGNAEKLKKVCEINGINFNENDLTESLKKYTNFMMSTISQYYDLGQIDSNTSLFSNFISEVNFEEKLNKLNSESPYNKIPISIFEKLLFLLELNICQSFNGYDNNLQDIIVKGNINKFSKEEFFLSPIQQLNMKNLFSFLYKYNGSINQTRLVMYKQFIKIKIREMGLKNYCGYLKESQSNNQFSKTFFNTLGCLSNSIKNSLTSDVESVSHLNLITPEMIHTMLKYYLLTFNDYIKNLVGSQEYLIFKMNNLILNLSEINVLVKKGIKFEYLRLKYELEIFVDYSINFIFSNNIDGAGTITHSNNNVNNEKMNKLKSQFLDIFKLVLSNMIFLQGNDENNRKSEYISEIILNNLNSILELKINENNLDMIASVLDFIYYISPILNSHKESYSFELEQLEHDSNSKFEQTRTSDSSEVIKLINKLCGLIINSETYETVSLSCKICKCLIKNCGSKLGLNSLNDGFFNSIYDKLGRLFLFKNNKNLNSCGSLSENSKKLQELLGGVINYNYPPSDSTNQIKINTQADGMTYKYFVVIQMNSPEIDYQFLINALYYWEEKYPTKLSLYNYREFNDYILNQEKTKEKEILDIYGISKNPNISANININNSGQKIKMFNYFNQLKSKTTKMNLLEKIADERISNLRKAIDEGTKMLNVKTEGATNSKLTAENLESIRERVIKLKQQEAYQCRIKAHIKTAELIGETACTRGFVCLEPAMTQSLAEELAEVVHKAYNRLLPHFKANIDEHVNLFSDDLIYPKMPEKDTLLPGCTNTLKETTQNFMNVSLFEESVYERFDSTLKQFTDSVKKLAQTTNYQPEKITKIGYYNNNYLMGYSYALISQVNFNDKNIKRIIESNSISGVSVSMIIDDMLNMVYTTFENKETCHKLIENLKDLISCLNKGVYCSSDISNSNPGDTINKNGKINLDNLLEIENIKMKILGILLVISGYYKVLRNNSKAIFNKNPDDICKILSGGHKSGKNHSHVIFLKEKNVKIEKVNNKDLEKLKLNSNLIDSFCYQDIIEILIKAYLVYLDNKEIMINKLILHLVLKILSEKKIEGEEIKNLLENENDSDLRNKIDKFVEILRSLSNETLWLEKDNTFWETEFIEAFERIYNRMDVNAEKIYAPVFDISYLASQKVNFYPIVPDNAVNADLISKYGLPESNYTKQLVKITDLSKCQTALKNIQNFDRYLVGEIYQYNIKQWREDDFLNAFYQIRNYLSIGDMPNAYADLNQILDGAKIPAYMFPPREHFDSKEITKEECYPSNYYLARLNNKFLRESGIKSFNKQGGIGINEIPVLLLLHDNTIGQALVLYNDYENGKLYTFWTPIESLSFLDNQIKIPANSFKISELVKEYKYLEKRLRILYSKNVLGNIMRILATERKIKKFDELMYFISLSNWQIYRHNPTSGPFHKFKNYISIKPKKWKVLRSGSGVKLGSNQLLSNASQDTNESQIKISQTSTSYKQETQLEKSHPDYTFNINEFLSSVSQRHSSSNSSSSVKNRMEFNLEKILNELYIKSTTDSTLSASEMIIQWCMKNWETIDKSFLKIKSNLFKEFNVNYNEVLRSRNVFHVGNFSHKMLALHELTEIDISSFAGIVLTFEKEAYLGPHAKISFYSDPYGENLIHEIISIKTIKYNLESVVFNYPKVWMYYHPGTRAFSIFEWFTQSRDSHLPCSIVYVPYTWSTLISLTDYSTSSLFADINKDSLGVFQRLIKNLMVHCTSLSLPADIQRRIFNLTNRAILKGSKYLSLLETQGIINLNDFSISQKFNLLGIDEYNVTQLINNINTFNNSKNIPSDTNTYGSNSNFSSAYIVEGVEIILSILSVIKESFHTLDRHLKDTFEYSLPVWIEAIIKLGQFLNFLQGNSPLDGELMKEIHDQLMINNQFEKFIIVKNLSKDSDNEKVLEEFKKLLSSSNAKIVDVKKDIQILNEEASNTKSIVILTDGFFIDKLSNDSEEEKKLEPTEEPFWECYFCHMENDKDNTFCIFCDKNKKIKPKDVKKEKPKSSLIKVESYVKTVSLKMNNLISSIKNSQFLNLKEDNKIDVYGGEDIKINSQKFAPLLNEYFEIRMKEYVKEGDYIKEKIRNLKNIKEFSVETQNYIEILNNLINSKFHDSYLEAKKMDISYFEIYQKLQVEGVDFWLENILLDTLSMNNEIDITIMEKLRELVDLKICKEKDLSLILPATSLRFVAPNFENLNHTSVNHFENYYSEIRTLPLSKIRYYWAIIKYFNNCLAAALPFIKPPDTYANTTDFRSSDEEGYTHIPFPKTISAFLSTARGITISFTKLNLIKEIISSTEFNEEEVQIPTFKFERLNIQNNIEKNNLGESSSGSNLNLRRANMMIVDEPDNQEKTEKKKSFNSELTQEESMFLQAYEQAKEVDSAFFRSKKVPGDPYVGFKVEFKGELVQGIGGPYRQFFSDISAELQDKSKKTLKLLIPTLNNLEEKGEYKDRWTLNSSYNSNTALNHLEFLGVLMSICIRTGVHLTLDLCSLIWKKIVRNFLIFKLLNLKILIY
jgi:hypothetical protein